jgi:hypothetical protein
MEPEENGAISIECRTSITAEEFLLDFAQPNKPVLLKGYMKNWPAYGKWNWDFLADAYGNTLLTVSSSNQKKNIGFSDFVQYCKQSADSDPYYLRDWALQDEAPELFKDYETPPFFLSWLDFLPAEIKPRLKWLYIGPKGSGSPLHTDIWDTSAWNGVFVGKKLWHFFPLNQLDFLYDLKVDTFNPDYDKYPLLKKVTPIRCIQDPGDIVFTPSGWIHQVYNLEAGISVTENFINKTNADLVREIFVQNNEPTLLRYLDTLRAFVSKNNISI